MSKKTALKTEYCEKENMKALRRIQQEAQHGNWQAGQWVGLLAGKVVAASFDWNEVVAAVEKQARDRREGMLFRIGDNYDEVERML